MSLKDRLAREAFRQFRLSEKNLHELKYLFWECTLRCNLACLHCGSDCHADATTQDMPADVFLEQLQLIGERYEPKDIMVVITGGEPLLRNDLADIGAAIRKLGFRWGLVTNGFRLQPKNLNNLINAGLGAITLSVDGLEAEHNWLRNHPKAFSNASQALELILKYPRLNADVVTCINKRNINHLPAIRDYLISKGLRQWRLFTITPIGRAQDNPDLHLDKQELRRLMDFIVSCKQHSTELNVNFSCESYIGRFEEVARDGLFFCRAGIHIGSILADGAVSACPNIDHKLVQGNINNRSFVDIWENEFEKFRNRKWTKTGPCKNCKEYRYCEGNGLHWWDYSSKQILRCHFTDLQQ